MYVTMMVRIVNRLIHTLLLLFKTAVSTCEDLTDSLMGSTFSSFEVKRN